MIINKSINYKALDNKELFHCTVHFQVGSGEGQEELSGAKMASVMLTTIQSSSDRFGNHGDDHMDTKNYDNETTNLGNWVFQTK